MPFLTSPPQPVVAPITSLAKAPSIQQLNGAQWLSLGWYASIANAQLMYRIVIVDGTGNRLYISPVMQVASDAVATDSVFLASNNDGTDGIFKIPPSGVTAYVLPITLNPSNPTPPATAVVTWTVAGCAD